MFLFLSAAIKTRCVSLHGLASALLAHDGHAASHRTNVNLSLTYGQSGGEKAVYTLRSDRDKQISCFDGFDVVGEGGR